MRNYGLVLAGGGAKGAYQIGAWKALVDMGITFNAIAGTSIGSINGALIAAGDFEKAHEMWLNISIDKGLKINEELPEPENLFSKKNWGTLFKEVIKNGGLDASPAADFISLYVDEAKVRESGIPFFAIAVQMTQGVTPREIGIDEIPEGKLTDYLMASSNIPLAVGIGPEGEKFLDGGAYDNIPLMTLKKRGYNRIIILDISNLKGVGHSMNNTNCEIVHIKPYDTEMLGKFMNLDAEAVEKRIQLGYLDAKKAFSELLGNIYYFQPETFRGMVQKYGPDTMVSLEKLAYYLSVAPCKIYTENEFITAVKIAYEEEQKRLQEEAAAAEEKARETEFESIKTAIKKRFPSKAANDPIEDEAAAELAEITEVDFETFKDSIKKHFPAKASTEVTEKEPVAEITEVKESDFDTIKNIFKKYFPTKVPTETEPETDEVTVEVAEAKEYESFIESVRKTFSSFTSQDELTEGKEKERIRTAIKKRFGQKNPLDEFTDAIAVLDNIIL